MKKILLTVSIFVSALAANAQIVFQEDFESGGTTWTNVDQDGDGFKWTFQQMDQNNVDGQGKVANSASFDNNAGAALTPDNYLISPAIIINSADLILSFKVKGQDPDWSQEHYAVYVTTASDVATISAATPVLEETLPPGTENYLIRTVDLSAFSGQTVYVTFRHFNVTDMFSINIDDVFVRSAFRDIKMLASTTPTGVQPGNANISGTVMNLGNVTIDSILVSYDTGSGAVNGVINGLNIAPGATYSFTHPTPLAVVVGDYFNINLCAKSPNDADNTNDCTSDAIDFVISAANAPDKYVVVEEKTGTWCGYCPYGTVALDELHANEPMAIEIAIHNQDPMTITSYDTGSNSFPKFGGYPYSAIDRVIGDHAFYSGQHVNTRKSTLAPASVSFDKAQKGGNTITVTAKATMATDMSGDYRLAVVLIEEQVKGASSTDNSWKQHNYFTSSLNNENLIAVDGTNWKNLPEYVDQVAVFGGYNHVARALGNNAINGDAGSLPATLTNGQAYTYTYTFTVDPSWVVSNMQAVAMLVKNSTGEVLNSKQTPIVGTTGIDELIVSNFDIDAYPNPSNGNTNIKVDLEQSSTVAVNVYNVVGKLVYQVPVEKLAAGAHVYPIKLNVKSGVYFAHISVNGTKQIVKLNVVK